MPLSPLQLSMCLNWSTVKAILLGCAGCQNLDNFIGYSKRSKQTERSTLISGLDKTNGSIKPLVWLYPQKIN